MVNLRDEIQALRENAIKDIGSADSIDELEKLRVAYLGKKGEITIMLKGLKDLDLEQRKKIGSEANALKDEITSLLDEKHRTIGERDIKRTLWDGKGFDITLPGTSYPVGSLNPVTIVQKEVEKIFEGMGFNIVSGPEVEDDFHNFGALNIPQHHPARDMQDTYWLENGQLLRTHTHLSG